MIVTMQKANDKTLLILGLIRSHKVHGYQINELIKMPGMPIMIGKPNLYRILEDLEKRGWISFREEREGNHPIRRIYSITAEGEKQYRQQLEEQLAGYIQHQIPGAVPLLFLDSLPAKKRLELLTKRCEGAKQKMEEFKSFSPSELAMHPGIDFIVSQNEFEYQWLTKLITKITKEEGNEGTSK